MTPKKLFFAALAPLLAFRLWLSAALPVTADEAYFIWWGKIPDWGYYDHPPMIGWWFAAQLLLGDAGWWLRLTSTLQPFVLAAAAALMLPRIWPEMQADRRWWALLLIMAGPAAIWNVLVTTDVALIYFSVFSGLAWLRARRDGNLGWYLLSGVFLAGAVLSKYFVALLGFAYLVDTLWRPNRRKLAGLALTYACMLPALAQMAWWNAGNCWPNFMFNFVNRHDETRPSWETPVSYVLMMTYLLTPLLLWRLTRGLKAVAGETSEATRALRMLVAVPLLLFALLSVTKNIGLHWVLSFLPFAFILFALREDEATVARGGRQVAVFATFHVVAFLVVAQLPLETWQRVKGYQSAVLAFESKRIAAHLEPHAADYVLASDGYADASTLGYVARRYYIVFGPGSNHARHDDILTDVRNLDGRNILILRKSPPQQGEYDAFFREIRTEPLSLRGVTFTLVFGRGFDYARYRDSVLAMVRDRYYAVPGWLPQTGCYFCARYFPGVDRACGG